MNDAESARAAAEVCAREPIQSSGAIQPHGWLLSCVLPDWTVRHASANIAALLDVEADELIGQSLRDHIDDDVLQSISDVVGFSEGGAAPQRAAVANVGPMAQLCDVGVHVQQGLIHIEIEAQPNRVRERTPTLVAQTMIARLASAVDADAFHDRIATQVRELTGYDRVMVYRFRHDEAGDVIAESRADDLEPYLGLRYPATDIPPQARALYLRNRLRVIPDARYRAVAIVPPLMADGAPLDLSQHALRSVSPVHLEYLANMGVAASMSISIVSGGRLWGLIACHHRAPRVVPPGIRAAADLFGMFVSMQVSAREQDATARFEDHARGSIDALALRLRDGPDRGRSLLLGLAHLRAAVPCDGVATYLHGEWDGGGRVPDSQERASLLDWLQRQDQASTALTHRRADWCDDGAAGSLAGVLAIPLASTGDWLFFFRAEQVEDVHWAGDPAKSMVAGDDGLRISPRRSFASWKQTVRGESVAWRDTERRSAQRLRMMLNEHGRRATEPASLVADREAYRRRNQLRDQGARLGQLSGLLEGMVHIEPEDATRLGERIAALEAELRALMTPRAVLED